MPSVKAHCHIEIMSGRHFLNLFILLATTTTIAQSFTSEQAQQGYALFGDKVTFIFDENIYDRKPKNVSVTGEFRNWDQAMDNTDWELKKTASQWLLTFDNTDYSIVKPNTKFKFRIDNGEWMDPPSDAVNKKGGDLVFLQDAIMDPLLAEIRQEDLIWAQVKIDRPLSVNSYRLTDATGRVIPISEVLPHNAIETLIIPEKKLDLKRVYFLEIPEKGWKTHCAFDGWFREVYSDKELGAIVQDDQTIVRLFAPRAEAVKIYLYQGRNDVEASRVEDLSVDENGIWEITFPEDLHGTYYDFTIHGADDPGNYFYETTQTHVNDPYARVSDNTWGKARIWRKTVPAEPLKNGIPKMEDVIAYEVHVQDFTDRLPLSDELKGTIPGMTQKGLKNSKGEKIGFDYLVDLGINVLHLMPVQEYLHFPDEDWKASFQDDQYMIEQGVSEENYQWGYRTTFAFAVESKYRTRGKEPGEERDEFRNLVQAFHDEGIAVIIDIVPNHTGENMDGNGWLFNFNGIDKQYYYRTKDFEHIGAYGNEVKTEERPMVQRWLIDQCLHWVNEFGIDGFRIDLAGQIDQQTLLTLKEALGPDKIVYGEAWIGSNDPNFENNPDWDWYKEDAPITFFQDDSRNAYKGPVFELRDPLEDRGWPGGKWDERDNVMKGLSAGFPTDKTPLSGISYLDIHDNFALADQFGEDFDGRLNVDQDLYKIAVTLLYTTLGPLVTHGGSEIMRSKAHAPLKEVIKTTKDGYKVYMHGYRDTYNHRTANQFIWENVGRSPENENKNDYAAMLSFWKGMNAFRLSEYGEVFRIGETPEEGYYQWITPENQAQLGYIVDDQIMVLINADTVKNSFEGIDVPAGKWKLIATNEEIDHINGVAETKDLAGAKKQSFNLEAKSLRIWRRER